MYQWNHHHGIQNSLIAAAVVSAVSTAISAVGNIVGGPLGEFLNAIGGPMLLVFWSGLMLGWKLRGERQKEREEESGKPSRAKRKGIPPRGGKSSEGSSGVDPKS